MADPAAKALARHLAGVLETMKAQDLVVLDVSALHSLIQCFVIATATSSRHALVLAEEALARVKAQGIKPWHLEVASDWVCGDFGDVVLHVFIPETRTYYDLDGLWADAERLSWESEGAPGASNTARAS